jgi:hypothetical protein
MLHVCGLVCVVCVLWRVELLAVVFEWWRVSVIVVVGPARRSHIAHILRPYNSHTHSTHTHTLMINGTSHTMLAVAPVRAALHPSIHPSIRPSIHPSIHPSIPISSQLISVSVSVSVSLCFMSFFILHRPYTSFSFLLCACNTSRENKNRKSGVCASPIGRTHTQTHTHTHTHTRCRHQVAHQNHHPVQSHPRHLE